MFVTPHPQYSDLRWHAEAVRRIQPPGRSAWWWSTQCRLRVRWDALPLGPGQGEHYEGGLRALHRWPQVRLCHQYDVDWHCFCERYPMELHMVHRNIHDEEVSEALEHENGLTVLGFKFQVIINIWVNTVCWDNLVSTRGCWRRPALPSQHGHFGKNFRKLSHQSRLKVFTKGFLASSNIFNTNFSDNLIKYSSSFLMMGKAWQCQMWT